MRLVLQNVNLEKKSEHLPEALLLGLTYGGFLPHQLSSYKEGKVIPQIEENHPSKKGLWQPEKGLVSSFEVKL